MYNDIREDLLTIVTVTYNAENFLEETLLSINNQSYKNIIDTKQYFQRITKLKTH